MNLEQFARNLEAAEVDRVGIEHWLKYMENPLKAMKDFESSAILEHPIQWYNPKIATFARFSGIPEELRNYFYMQFLTKLIPDPTKISTWPEMKALILEITKTTNYITKRDALLPVSKSFLDKFENRSACELQEWKQEQLYGSVWGTIAQIIRMANRAQSTFPKECEPFIEMQTRLQTPSSDIEIRKPKKTGLLMLSSHSRFNSENFKNTKRQLRDQVFAVSGSLVKDEAVKSVLPMLMLKALKSGKAVYSAVDGKGGNLELEMAVFGSQLHISSSFTWVAWQAECESQWSFLIANETASGTRLYAQDILLPGKSTTDYETFCESFTHILGKEIEIAMIDHPFSFGSYQHVGRDLLRP